VVCPIIRPGHVQNQEYCPLDRREFFSRRPRPLGAASARPRIYGLRTGSVPKDDRGLQARSNSVMWELPSLTPCRTLPNQREVGINGFFEARSNRHAQDGIELHSAASTMVTAVLFLLHAGSLQLVSQVPKKMLCVHVAGNEIGPGAHNFRQNRFAISVNRCHLDQINDASPHILCVMRFFPSRFELIRPLPDQLILRDHLCSSGKSVIVIFSITHP
jgi:hypothetical protein